MEIFPELKTIRLKLRKIQGSDLSFIVKHANNKNISDNVLNIPYPYSEEDAVFWFNFAIQGFKSKEHYTFAITQKEKDEFIGGMGLHIVKDHNRAELGYWIAEPFWNKGIATEATSAVLKFGFEKLNLNKIYATHFFENQASGKVLLKNGMIKEAALKDHYRKNNVYLSVDQYRLTKEEYEALNKIN